MFKVGFLSQGQILTGINYLQGSEKIGEEDIPFREIQVGLIFVILSLVIYKRKGGS